MTKQEYSKTYRYTVGEVVDAIKLDIPEGHEVYDIHSDSSFVEEESASYIYFRLQKKE